MIAFLIFGLFDVEGEAAWKETHFGREARLSVDRTHPDGFTSMLGASTGAGFTNILSEIAANKNHNLLNGSGLALGDVDGDGLCDVYLCGLSSGNKLFKNLGGWRFEDITAQAGAACAGRMSRGAALVDVDGDSDLDLIVTFSGEGASLFINNGLGEFHDAGASELAARTGPASIAVGDVDLDGDLDLYVVNYGETTIRSGMPSLSTRVVNGQTIVAGRLRNRLRIIDGKLVEYGEPDAFYLNDGAGRFQKVEWTQGRFLDENGRALQEEQWDMGLSAMFRDINQDGLPDLYVCNDFQNPERIWVNQGRGVFRAIPREAIRTSSHFSMGVDFADVNRDGLDDFFVVDMLSRSHSLRMRQLAPHSPSIEHTLEEKADRPQIRQNTFYLNRGDGSYSEIANFAGLAASDWSWCPVFLDVDLDGYEDILVVNGHAYDTQDLDVINDTRSRDKTLEMFPSLRTPNFAFHNQGNLHFVEKGAEWRFNSEEVAHGIALADLDNDGDQDMVVNCLNAAALFYRNDSPKDRIAVQLKGLKGNSKGIGARITVSSKSSDGSLLAQSQEMIAGGRYLASDQPLRAFAALDDDIQIDVLWPGGAQTRITDARPNTLYEIDQAKGSSPSNPPPRPQEEPLFEEAGARLSHRHSEDVFNDFALQPLLPKALNNGGPGVAFADLNQDGYDDFVVGAGRGGGVSAFINDGTGVFSPAKTEETGAPTHADAAGIATASIAGDLVVASAISDPFAAAGAPGILGWRFGREGVLASSSLHAIPEPSALGPIAVADIDQDGDLDVFAGGRFVPGHYPVPAPSFVFRLTDGKLEIDAALSGRFKELGLVNGAVFTDLNDDGYPDLVIAGDWAPLRIFKNVGGKDFEEVTDEAGLANFKGFWNSVTTGDFNGDGLMDLAAGNWGLNSDYQPSASHPNFLFYGSDGTAMLPLVEGYSGKDGALLPWRNLLLSPTGEGMIATSRHRTHARYGEATLPDILGPRWQTLRRLEINYLSSAVFLNRGGKFEPLPLPDEAQFAPAFHLAVADFDLDGHEDLFVAQNFFGTPSDVPRQDAGRGLLLLGLGNGAFKPVPAVKSGIKIYGEQRGAAVTDVDLDGRPDLVVGQNGDQTILFMNATQESGVAVRLKGSANNPNSVGARMRRIGSIPAPAKEIVNGSGYWSQSGTVVNLPMSEDGIQVEVRWPGGARTVHRIPSDQTGVVELNLD